eukprot:1176080-Prorocentrum_minimum.AAC.2
MELKWSEVFLRGIGCNWLVCLAVWLAYASNDIAGKSKYPLPDHIHCHPETSSEQTVLRAIHTQRGLYFRHP